MNITSIGYIIFYVIVTFCLCFFGSVAGFTVNGVDMGSVSASGWDATAMVSYFFCMVTFV
jgi:hypothetical protein